MCSIFAGTSVTKSQAPVDPPAPATHVETGYVPAAEGAATVANAIALITEQMSRRGFNVARVSCRQRAADGES
jgi:hypothetical protein